VKSVLISFVLILSFAMPSISRADLELDAAGSGGVNTAIVNKLESDLKRVDTSIEITKNKISSAVEIGFLPDLYFVLGELMLEKARLSRVLKREKQPNTPEAEMDFTAEKRMEAEALENYKMIEDRYPNYKDLDKVLFTLGIEAQNSGRPDEALVVLKKIITRFNTSPYAPKAFLEVGNIFFEKKDFEFALEQYLKLIAQFPKSIEAIKAKNKAGWCLTYQGKFLPAFINFESIFETVKTMEPSPETAGLLEDTILAMIWPYSELTPKDFLDHPAWVNALVYFEGLTSDKMVYRKFLNRFGQRMELKIRHKDASQAYLELFRLSDDLLEKKGALEKYYFSMKKQRDGLIPLWFSKEVGQVLWQLSQAPTQKGSTKFDVKPFEPLMRDIATQIHKMGLKTKRKEDLIGAAEAYDHYLWVFPKTKWSASMQVNMAEAFYHGENFVQAGLWYHKASKSPSQKKNQKQILDSAIESFTEALKNSQNLNHVDRIQAREGFRVVANEYSRLFPGSQNIPGIRFNYAKSLYDEQKYGEAVAALRDFIKSHPDHKLTSQASLVLLDCFYVRNDMKGLANEGRTLASNSRIPANVRAEINRVVQQARLKGVQSIAGDFTSKRYAEKFLEFAKKNKGSQLGEKALLEAYASFKASKDPRVYSVGEAYLAQYMSSAQSKEIMSSLIQLAMNTSDYGRAARYLALYGVNFPQDPEAKEYLLQSAQINEQLGDLDSSAATFTQLGRAVDTARVYRLAQNWSALNETASRLGGAEGRYYQGLALYRMGRKEDGLLLLRRSLEENSSSPETKALVTHSAVILAENDLEEFRKQSEGKPLSVDALKSLIALYREIDAKIQESISRGAGTWVVSLLYLSGRLSQSFGSYLESASLPAQLNQPTFKNMLAQQIKTYKESARSFYANCLKAAEENEIFTKYVAACQSDGKMSLLENQEFNPRLRAEDDDTKELTAIRQKLVESPRSIELLYAYAKTLMERKNFSFAGSVLRRCIEIESGRAESYAYLGVIQMYMNLFDDAVLNFREALKRDPNNATALHGLNGLYKRFRFQRKLASIQSRMASAGNPKSPLHPWMKR
jgi:tetratricopeptide (TPR) repeat protein